MSSMGQGIKTFGSIPPGLRNSQEFSLSPLCRGVTSCRVVSCRVMGCGFDLCWIGRWRALSYGEPMSQYDKSLLQRITMYALRCSTRVLIHTTKYYSSIPYCKVLFRYYSVALNFSSVLKSIIAYYKELRYSLVLLGVTRVLFRSTKYCSVLPYCKVLYSGTIPYYTALLRYYKVVQSVA